MLLETTNSCPSPSHSLSSLGNDAYHLYKPFEMSIWEVSCNKYDKLQCWFFTWDWDSSQLHHARSNSVFGSEESLAATLATTLALGIFLYVSNTLLSFPTSLFFCLFFCQIAVMVVLILFNDFKSLLLRSSLSSQNAAPWLYWNDSLIPLASLITLNNS